MMLLRFSASLCLLLASTCVWAQTSTDDSWGDWLSASGLSGREEFDELLLETAGSLNMESQELLESLVASAGSEDAPDPVVLLLQLRDELQLDSEESTKTAPADKRLPEAVAETDTDEVDDVAGEATVVAEEGGEVEGEEMEEEEEEAEGGDDKGEVTKETEEEGSKMEAAKSMSLMNEVRKQVQDDMGQLKKAAELFLPEPVLIALGQAINTMFKVAQQLHETFTVAVLPRLNTYVFNEGSPGRKVAEKVKGKAVLGFKALWEKVELLINPQEGDPEEENTA